METIRGRVGIPHEYFLRMAKQDYANYLQALAREFYQNSIDAGAGNISVDFDKDQKMITVTDDGCGMDLNTIKEKLLVLGGTKKPLGAVGAFGKAKEILFFSWNCYEIRTGNWFIQGCGADYTITEVDDFVYGTICKIQVQSEFEEFVRSFINVASWMEVDTKFLVIGAEVDPVWRKGHLVKELSWCKVYQVKKESSSVAKVRLEGIWMFDWPVGDNLGRLTLELSRSSIECLTSNRDGLLQKWRDEAFCFMNELQVDKKSALRPRPRIIKEKIKGAGKVSVDSIKDKMKSIVAWKSAPDVLQGLGLVTNAVAEVRIESLLKEVQSADGLYDAVDRICFIGYEPDFIIHYDERKLRRVKKFMSRPKARVLAAIWTDTVKQILLDNERFIEFTAGFLFEDGVNARSDRSGAADVCFLLNPLTLKKAGKRRLLIEEMKERAIHEVSHLKFQFHNEDFVCEMSEVRKGTWSSLEAFRKIRRTKTKLN